MKKRAACTLCQGYVCDVDEAMCFACRDAFRLVRDKTAPGLIRWAASRARRILLRNMRGIDPPVHQS